jgi:oligoribonuclease NrnB/cAMP/cGMP phosphodiesterase (DHH superfamily)
MKKILKEIFNDILEISDINMQRKLWLNENNNTGLISSYIELMSRLFDDNNFSYIIDNEVIDLGLKPELILSLKKLRDDLDGYVEKETDAEIVTDPKWIEISKQAESVIKIWL